MPNPNTSSQITEFFINSGNALIDPLLTGGKWGANIGTGATVSFSFPSTGFSSFWSQSAEYGYGYSFSETQTFSPLNNQQIASARSALQTWGNVANINFVEVAETTSNVGDIRFGFTTSGFMEESTYAYAYTPSLTTLSQGRPDSGDVWLNPNPPEPTGSNFNIGQAGYHTLMHEIGHAIGLDHPFSEFFGDKALPFSVEHFQYTIMSYSDSAFTYDNGYSQYYPTTPMLYDILAIQYLYGANMAWQTGDNIYTYNDFTKYFETIWDAGGNDTIQYDASINALIDLNQGQFSDLGQDFLLGNGQVQNNNVGIAFNTFIENATGGSGNDRIFGNQQDNILNGREGNDFIAANNGNDTLIYTGGIDSLDGGLGTDLVDFSSMASSVWVGLAFSGFEAWTKDQSTAPTLSNGTWRSLADLINIENIVGSNFNDELIGNAANNQMTGGLGNDILEGGSGNDSLLGGDGNDTLLSKTFFTSGMYDGGADSDTLDFSQADSITSTRRLNEGAGVSVDLSAASAYTYFVSASGFLWPDARGIISLANIENVTGSIANDVLTGDANANTLRGAAGNDTLSGGTGLDTLIGGLGNDAYVFDGSDVISEAANEGSDTILSSVSYTLNIANVENVTLTGSSHINATGNSGNNLLTGNAGNNVLFYTGGVDTLDGGLGNDTADFSSMASSVWVGLAFSGFEAWTKDQSSAPNLSNGTWRSLADLINIENVVGSNFNDELIGNAANNQMTGGLGNDILEGGSGNDILMGGLGNDRLTGGTGTDIFVFDSVLNPSTNVDSITDFVSGVDDIQLSASIFTALNGAMTGANFVSGTGLVNGTTADSLIVYNRTTGALYYDADANGANAAVQFATLTPNLSINAQDFLVA